VRRRHSSKNTNLHKSFKNGGEVTRGPYDFNLTAEEGELD